MIDEVLVMLMKAPHTYTGENTVEINCHGGVYVMRRVLDILIKNGGSRRTRRIYKESFSKWAT